MSLTTSAPASAATCDLFQPSGEIPPSVYSANVTESSYLCSWKWATRLDAVSSCCTGNKKVSTVKGECVHWCIVKDIPNSNDEMNKFFNCLADVEKGAAKNRGCMLVYPDSGSSSSSSSVRTTGTATGTSSLPSGTIKVTMSTSASVTGTPAGGETTTTGVAPGTVASPSVTPPAAGSGGVKSVTVGGLLISSLALIAFLI